MQWKRILLLFGWAVGGFAGSARAELLITEVMYNPASTTDSRWEFVEVVNQGASQINLAGFVLDDDDGDPLGSANVAGGSLPPGGVAVLYNDAATPFEIEQAWSSTPLFVPVSSWSALNNSGDRLGIWSSLTNYGARDFALAEDELQFANTSPWPSDDGVSSIYLTDLMADSSDGSQWALSQVGIDGAYASAPAGDNGAVNVGSPGIAVPEPSAGVIAGLGLLALTLGSRRQLGRI